MAEIRSIPFAYIKPNPLNLYLNSEDSDQIEILAESIREIGLTQPLAVYEKSENEYIIIGGHKRYEALKRIGYAGMSDILCVIQKKPKSEVEERERLLQNNISRKSPEELEKQVEEAHNLWNTMSSDRRAYYTEKFKRAFIAKNGDDPVNIDQNFRARLDYIRALTGLTISNRTVTAMLKRKLEKTAEAFPAVIKEAKPVTSKDIIRRAVTLIGLIGICEEEMEPGEKAALEAAEISLRTMVEVFS